MPKLIALYLVTCYVSCITLLGYASDTGSGPNCEEPKSPKMNWMGDFSNRFKRLYMCNHETVARGVRDDEGRWYVSYRANTNLNSGREADELCDCMTKFVLRESGWGQGAVAVCKPECTSLTVFIIGARNPDFIDLRPVTDSDTCAPIKIMGVAVEHYPDVPMAGKNCKSRTGHTNIGQFTLTAECENDPNPQEICEIMFAFWNEGEFLTDSTTHECTVKNNKLYLEVVENSVTANCH